MIPCLESHGTVIGSHDWPCCQAGCGETVCKYAVLSSNRVGSGTVAKAGQPKQHHERTSQRISCDRERDNV